MRIINPTNQLKQELIVPHYIQLQNNSQYTNHHSYTGTTLQHRNARDSTADSHDCLHLLQSTTQVQMRELTTDKGL